MQFPNYIAIHFIPAFVYLQLIFTLGEQATLLECGIRLWLVLHGSCTEMNFIDRHPYFWGSNYAEAGENKILPQ
jgi:hypothetical protein